MTDAEYVPGRTLSPVVGAVRLVAEEYASRAKSAQYREDPVLWARERIKINLWSMQREIAMSLVTSDRVVVKSCHAIGKTYLAAILVCWWIDTHPPTQTMVVSTAPTANQVNKLLWEYIRVIHREHKLGGNVSEAAEWKSSQRDVIGQGRKPADTNISAFQGTHAKYLLVVLDEAGGVPDVLWTGMRSVTTGEYNRTLAIGNPDDPATEFGRIFLQDYKQWTKFTVSAYDTPNFTGEDVSQTIKDNLISKKWVEEAEETWGIDDARFKSKVLAEFPEESTDTLFPPSLLMKAIGENAPLPTETDRPKLGVDVARFGDDKTTVVMNYGGVCSVVDSWNGLDLVASAHRVHDLAMKLGVSEVRVDDSGLGGGLTDNLAYLAITNYIIFRMVGSAASPDLNKWVNARAYWHDMVRYMMRNGSLSLPDFHAEDSAIGSMSKTLFDEMQGIRYKFGARNAMQIESKDEMRKRIKKSPDYSDALIYACAPINIDVDPFALSGVGPGDTVYTDPFSELMLESGNDFLISPY